jgi:hypothetical protein
VSSENIEMSQMTTTELQDRAETITSHLDAIETAADDGPAVGAGITRQAIEQRLDELVAHRVPMDECVLTGTVPDRSVSTISVHPDQRRSRSTWAVGCGRGRRCPRRAGSRKGAHTRTAAGNPEWADR